MVSAFDGQLRVLECAESLEITPVLGWHKGTAVRMIVESLRATDSLTVYAGDSLNDSEAFTTVNDMDGVSIAVGPEAPPGALIRVDHPDEVIEWLGELSAKISAVSAKRSSTISDGSIGRVRPGQLVGPE
jgi:trehalose-phosphatase